MPETTCRICYSGAENSDLFKPCRCSGTMELVHVDCLERWRRAGPAAARIECPQCLYRYHFSQSATQSSQLDRHWLILLLTTIVFLLGWFICVLLSYFSIRTGFVVATDSSTAFDFWTAQNTMNGLCILGMLGIIYSIFIDGTAFLAVFSSNPYSFHSISTNTVCVTMCIFAGLARIVAVIHCFLSSCTFSESESVMPSVVDIRGIHNSE